jgi:cytochrome c oxidase cbb3-type subunit 1
MHPYYIARAFGGLLFLTGACICLWNVVMTILHVPQKAPELDYPTSSEAMEPALPAAE